MRDGEDRASLELSFEGGKSVRIRKSFESLLPDGLPNQFVCGVVDTEES
jgi:hypothetical protein